MKNFKLLVVSLLTMIALVSCDVEPTNNDSAKTSVKGTWRNVTVETINLTTTPAASDKEGTWVSEKITYPTTPKVTTSNDGTTTTTVITHGIKDTETTTETTEVVVSASGSYVKTYTKVVSWAARSATGSATATDVNLSQIYAGSETTVNKTTVTVTVEGSAYKEVTLQEDSITYTGKTKGGNTQPNSTTSTETTTSYKTSTASLAFNNATAGLKQTVFGNTVAAPVNTAKTVTTTTTYTFKNDGTYTKDEVTVTDVPAVAAIAATYNTAAQLASDAGTSTRTEAVTGMYEVGVATYSEFSSYMNDSVALYLQEKTKAVSKIATGSLVSQDYPATVDTVVNNETESSVYGVMIGDESLVFNYESEDASPILYSAYEAE